MASPPLAGLLFEAGPLYLLALVAGLAALQGLAVIGMLNTAGYACVVPQQTASEEEET
jgi:hypothetical protein